MVDKAEEQTAKSAAEEGATVQLGEAEHFEASERQAEEQTAELVAEEFVADCSRAGLRHVGRTSPSREVWGVPRPRSGVAPGVGGVPRPWSEVSLVVAGG